MIRKSQKTDFLPDKKRLHLPVIMILVNIVGNIALDNDPKRNNTPKTMPYQALTIVEFKRPMRDDYNNSDNPIQQVLDYISLIREGKAKDKNGRLISGQLENLPIYVYIIADITPTLKKICIDNNFTTTPDNEGYFTYHSNRKAYIEIISYKKLLENAQQRNKMLFDKLFEQ